MARQNGPQHVSRVRSRMVILILCTLSGIGLGLLGDYLAGGISISLGDVLVSLLLSPVAVTFGGKAVTLTRFSNVFFVGGLLFWPMYCFLAWRWLTRGGGWMWLAILLWCFQGFFQVLHRLGLVMSA